jgi:hypothetical protein
LARFEKDFVRSDEAQLSLNELLDLLAVTGDAGGQSREDAIACYLSGSEGWRDAVKSLGGAFAEGESGLKERKAD